MIWLRAGLARLYMSLLIHGSREVRAPKHGSTFIHLKTTSDSSVRYSQVFFLALVFAAASSAPVQKLPAKPKPERH